MATKKVTVTLDETQLNRIRSLVETGTAPSVSGFGQHESASPSMTLPAEVRSFADALRATGGALSDEERAWAESPTTDVVSLDCTDATNVGRLLAASGTTDIVDAQVVRCARRSQQHVVSSDPGDLKLLDPSLSIIVDRGRVRTTAGSGR